MKFDGKIVLALCVLSGANAFVVQAPKTRATSALSSYLAGLGGGPPDPEDEGRGGPLGDPADLEDRLQSQLDTQKALEDRLQNQLANQNELEQRLQAFENKGSAPGGPVAAAGPPPRTSALSSGPTGDVMDVWEEGTPVIVQGNSLKTWSFPSPVMERVHVGVRTEGRPFDADIELWQGPDNTPMKLRAYVEDGGLRPFSAIIETPRGPNTVAVRNIGQLEFPMDAVVTADGGAFPSTSNFEPESKPMTIQGGALRTYPFSPMVESVAVCLTTDGRPLNTRIELLQGPNNIKQVMEVYTEDGMDRPFFAIIETPGSGNVVRVVNTATVEFPLTASVEPYMVGDGAEYMQPVIGGDRSGSIIDRVW